MRKTITLLLLALLTSVGAWAEETRDSVYFNDFEKASDWTAKGKTDGWTCNPGTTTANTFASKVIGVGAGSGDMGLVSPSFTIGNDVEIVDVELKFKMDACTSGKSSGIEFVTSDVNVNNGYVSSGTPFFAIGASANGNGYWGTLTVGGTDYKTTLNEAAVAYENNALNRNSTGIVTLNVRFNFTNKTATYSLTKGTTKVAEDVVAAFANANATTLDRIFLHAGKSYGGVTIDDVKVYSVTTDEVVTTYTATFTETNELNPTITIYSDEDRTQPAVNGTLEDNTTYYYRAVLAGYSNFEGRFTVASEDPAVSFTMEALPTYTFTVNAVSGNTVLKTLLTDDAAYDGKTYNVAASKYLTDDNNAVTYSKDDDTYYYSFTAAQNDATKGINYTAYNGIAYFYEGESYSALGTKIASGNCSGNSSGRGLNNTTMNLCTVAEAGQYTVSYAICSNNVKDARTYSFYRNSSDNTLDTQSCQWSVNYIKTTGSKSFEAGFAAGDVLQMYSSDGNIILDYVLLERTGDLKETVTVATEGTSTYVTTYPLDFSTIEGLTVLIATDETQGYVELSKVTQVPAGAPIIVKGEAGDYSVPVCDATTYSDNLTNKLEGSATAPYTVTADDNIYAIKKDKSEFRPVAATVVIPEKKAYFRSIYPVNANAKPFIIRGEEEDPTAVSTVEVVEAAKAKKFFNAAGQQVDENYKGFVITSAGKKIINK